MEDHSSFVLFLLVGFQVRFALGLVARLLAAFHLDWVIVGLIGQLVIFLDLVTLQLVGFWLRFFCAFLPAYIGVFGITF